jgi:hypothetical protein
LNRRTFWIAITAWSAKVCSSATSLSLNEPALARDVTTTPMHARPESIARPSGAPPAALSAQAGERVPGRADVGDLDAATVARIAPAR